MQVGIAIVVERGELAVAAIHVAHVLHALPGWEDLALSRRHRTHNLDQQLENTDASDAKWLEGLSHHVTRRFSEASRTCLLAGNPQDSGCRRIEGGRRGEGGDIIHRGEIDRLIDIAPMEDAPEAEQDERSLPG